MNREQLGLAPGAKTQALGQDATKYGDRNPINKWLITTWLKTIRQAIGDETGVIVDVGTGEGIALSRLALSGHKLIGVEYREDKLNAARHTVSSLLAVRGDIGMLPFPDRSVDLCLCLEVLEHLTRPDLAIFELSRVTRGRLLVSVPWEPFFRSLSLLRGRNLARLGRDEEHVQQFGPRSLRRALERHLHHVSVKTSFPWIIAIARAS